MTEVLIEESTVHTYIEGLYEMDFQKLFKCCAGIVIGESI